MATFMRLLADEDKATALADAVRTAQAGSNDPRTFVLEHKYLQKLPRAPFAYWVGPRTLNIFGAHAKFQSTERAAVSGGKTIDDFRFIRASWELLSSDHERWPV